MGLSTHNSKHSFLTPHGFSTFNEPAAQRHQRGGAGRQVELWYSTIAFSATTTVTLTQPPSKLSFVGTPNIDIISGVDGCSPSCITAGYGGPCCQAIVNVTGGVDPYTVTWLMDGSVSWGTGIVSDQFCSTNPYTTLQVTVVDGNGCTITSSINV